jgi:oligosaccharide repeat unit polymerase
MKLKDSIRDSKTAWLLWDLEGFLEKSATDSIIFKGLFFLLNLLYPKKLYRIIDANNHKQRSFLSKNIFSPVVIFPLIYLLFISLSDYRLSNLALITVGIGLLFFYLGTKMSYFSSSEIKLNRYTKSIGASLFTIGFVFLSVDLVSAGSIPLFDPAARSRLVVTYTMLAQLLPPGGILLISFFGEEYRKGKLGQTQARIYAFFVFFISILLISTLGFRTQIIVTLLGSFIAMYLTGLVGFMEVSLSLILAGFAVVSLGYYRAVVQGSPLGFFDVIAARIGLTMSVFDYLVKRFMPFGANKGYTLLATFSSLIPGLPGPRLGPRTIVARLFGIIGISVTSTLLGTIVLDLGIVGVVLFMLLLGHILGFAYSAAKTGFALGVGVYSVFLAYTLVGIETGLVDFNVIMMFLAGYLVLRFSK